MNMRPWPSFLSNLSNLSNLSKLSKFLVFSVFFLFFTCSTDLAFGKNFLKGILGGKGKKGEKKGGSKEGAKVEEKDGSKVAAVKKKPAAYSGSHHFFAFDEAPYFTSPDKRVGAKLIIDSAKVGPTLAAMQHLTYLPGASAGSHRHVYVTEIIYILKGNLTLRIDKEVMVMGPDATAYIPPQTFHELLNDSKDVCQFLQFYSPSGPEEEYRNWENPGEAKAAAAPPKATGPVVITARPAIVVPGSPQPVLGKVTEVDSPTPSNPPEKGYSLELKADSTISKKDSKATTKLTDAAPAPKTASGTISATAAQAR